jgi:hypothetical protein
MPRIYKRKPIEYRVDENGCFICTSHCKDGDGYSLITIKCRMYKIHRLIYEECFGEIPEGLVVRHKCDEPSCINPEHLGIGTVRDNVIDKFERGRNTDINGENNHMSKFTLEQIKSIRESDKSYGELAKEYGTTSHYIGRIKRNERWKEVVENVEKSKV